MSREAGSQESVTGRVKGLSTDSVAITLGPGFGMQFPSGNSDIATRKLEVPGLGVCLRLFSSLHSA